MTPQKLLSDISAGKFKPVYYFFGSEDYRITEAEKYIASQFLAKDQLTTNYRRIDGKKAKSADVIAELSVFPMLGERQVFAIQNFQRYKPTEVKRILSLLEPADLNRIVIFSSPSDKAPKKTSAFYKNVSSAGEAIEFKKMTVAEASGMIVNKLKKAGLTIDRDALGRLTEMIGGNRGALEAEINKIVDYKGELAEGDKQITVDDIGAVSAGFQVYSIFSLADYVVAGDLKQVLALIKSLIADGNSPTGLLFHLGNHFVSLYKVKNRIPLEPYRRFLTGRFSQQASKYDNERIEDIIKRIAQTDSDLRQGKANPGMILEALVINLVQAAK